MILCLAVVVAVAGWFRHDTPVRAAAGDPPAGEVTLSPPSGNSATLFTVGFSSIQSCPGNGDAGYLVHTFITPAGADVGGFTWNGFGQPTNGPLPTINLYSDGANALSNMLPDLNGMIVGLPQAQLAGGLPPITIVPPGAIPAGDYLIGVACVGPGLVTERWWATTVTLTVDADGGPSQLLYEPVAAAETTTSTTTTTTTTIADDPGSTTSSSTTTTLVGGATSTSTSIAGGAVTSSTFPSGSGGTSALSGSPGAYPQQQIASTGSSSWSTLVWALLLIVIGRIVYLAARPPRVVLGGR